MAKRTRAEEGDRAAWRARRAWPVAILGIDPGGDGAGAGLVLPDDFGKGCVFARSVDTDTLALEETIDAACEVARARRIKLVFVLEDWGKGGPLGIQGWMGLGAARGHWKRAAYLAATGRHADVLMKNALCAHAFLGTWRSMMDVPAGFIDEHGKFVRNDKNNHGWKRAATRRFLELSPNVGMDSADAAEGGLIAHYGSRCDAVGKLLPKRLLKEHGFAT